MTNNSPITPRLKRKLTYVLLPVALLLLGLGIYVLVEKDSIRISSSHTVNGRELPIYFVRTDQPKIALTFDAAWGAEDFRDLMNIIDKHDIKVTFFMTGGWVESYPKCVKELAKKGHELANHSENHKYMTTLNNNQMREEILSTHKKVKKLTGIEMNLFRAPYGDYNDAVVKVADEVGYYTIQWNVDSLDWKNYGTDSIIRTVCEHENLQNGAIILCHNGAKYTVSALDAMITNLKEQGYKFVTVGDLIYHDNYHMDAIGGQISDKKKPASSQ